jgi:single-stranded DNA-binding protein
MSEKNQPWNDINRVEVAGRIGVKPEIKITPKNRVVRTTLYVTNEYDSEQGRRKTTTRIPVILYGEKGTQFAEQVDTGDAVKVKGRLQENTWTDESSQKRSRIELVGFEYDVLRKKAA